ncbi:MAG TPA: STAS domain-containing protein [Steroidobacteraceae bacterium]|jgi:anti-anti-sigma regulatory factor|nr:STAS domain-containing protein [Steroidobacteraceae bacterium]
MANSRKSPRRSSAASPDEVNSAAASKPAEAAVIDLPESSAQPVNVLTLGASLSIREVAECAVQLKGLLAAGPLDIDAGKLETIDTAGIQLLLAAAAAAQRRGFKLKLRGAQGLKTGAARSLGLSDHLGELAEILP